MASPQDGEAVVDLHDVSAFPVVHVDEAVRRINGIDEPAERGRGGGPSRDGLDDARAWGSDPGDTARLLRLSRLDDRD